MYKLRLRRPAWISSLTGRPEHVRCVSDLGHVLSLTKIFDNNSRAMQFSNMTMRDISFIGFLKLNVFLILLPIFFNRLVGRFVRTANSLSEIRQFPQASQALPPTETVPPDPLALSSTGRAIFICRAGFVNAVHTNICTCQDRAFFGAKYESRRHQNW